jgi:hypothetical protein
MERGSSTKSVEPLVIALSDFNLNLWPTIQERQEVEVNAASAELSSNLVCEVL